jgi:hypothetical protein
MKTSVLGHCSAQDGWWLRRHHSRSKRPSMLRSAVFAGSTTQVELSSCCFTLSKRAPSGTRTREITLENDTLALQIFLLGLLGLPGGNFSHVTVTGASSGTLSCLPGSGPSSASWWCSRRIVRIGRRIVRTDGCALITAIACLADWSVRLPFRCPAGSATPLVRIL